MNRPSAATRALTAGVVRRGPTPVGVLPPLESGDHLSRAEFERRYEAHSEIKKAELIEGVVYVASPVRARQHGHPHSRVITWLGVYEAATPGVMVLDNATLRVDEENLRWEWLLEVSGLRYPKGKLEIGDRELDTQLSTSNLQSLISNRQWSAVQLFLQVARQVNPHFALEDELPHVVAICQLVEGMPLGIELAAAWVRRFSCQAIAQEIAQNLSFLRTSGKPWKAVWRSSPTPW